MTHYEHHTIGAFTHREDAQSALESLLARGLTREQMTLMSEDAATVGQGVGATNDAALKDIVVDGAIGTAVGTGVGVIAELALVAANVSLFVASPLLAPLAMLGWGAALGGTVGAAVGVRKKDRSLAALVRDAVAGGHFAVLVRTRAAEDTAIAEDVLSRAVGTRSDVATV